MENIQDSVPWGPGLGNTALESKKLDCLNPRIFLEDGGWGSNDSPPEKWALTAKSWGCCGMMRDFGPFTSQLPFSQLQLGRHGVSWRITVQNKLFSHKVQSGRIPLLADAGRRQCRTLSSQMRNQGLFQVFKLKQEWGTKEKTGDFPWIQTRTSQWQK